MISYTGDQGAIRYSRTVNLAGHNSYCLEVENTFAKSGLLPDTEDPNVAAIVIFLHFFIQTVVISYECKEATNENNLDQLRHKLLVQKNVLSSIYGRNDGSGREDRETEIKLTISLLEQYLQLVGNNEEGTPKNLEMLLDEVMGKSEANGLVVNTLWNAASVRKLIVIQS